ncbi:hypothetical protein QBC34DRAFT_155764 [Podospora aff. communis PSN243]|uniref:Uncharacterized protein n=1 Tax=Podospora aff. communis PSN243 TaxID=3040156 RepID=A0AAV9H3M5_9PEZI|nr:hypothetical protein QBC34DRAFT_155764 [Podospora aff. communis PSN243]
MAEKAPPLQLGGGTVACFILAAASRIAKEGGRDGGRTHGKEPKRLVRLQSAILRQFLIGPFHLTYLQVPRALLSGSRLRFPRYGARAARLHDVELHRPPDEPKGPLGMARWQWRKLGASGLCMAGKNFTGPDEQQRLVYKAEGELCWVRACCCAASATVYRSCNESNQTPRLSRPPCGVRGQGSTSIGKWCRYPRTGACRQNSAA